MGAHAAARASQIAKGGSLVPAKHTMQDIPTRGRKSTFVYALKPLYEFDLRRFQESATSCSEWTALGSVFNSQESALRLVSDLLLVRASGAQRGKSPRKIVITTTMTMNVQLPQGGSVIRKGSPSSHGRRPYLSI